MAQKPIHSRSSLREYQIAGLAGLVLVLGSIGAWAVFSSIHGAVIAPGAAVVETHSKKVQHKLGGIVAEIQVKEGDRVEVGSLLIRLDDTESRAELGIIKSVLWENRAKRARLIAERDDAKAVKFPDSMLDAVNDPETDEVLRGQKRLFATQRAALDGRKNQLAQRIEQFGQEIVGLEAQHASKLTQLELIRGELKNVKKLEKQGLVKASRVLALEREAARLDGERGQLLANIARTKGRIGETKLRAIQVDDDARSKTIAELRDVEAKIAEYAERELATAAKLKRTSITAPRTGIVHELSVHTIGGVIGAGETIMLIVPESDDVVIAARVRPQDIDQVHVGQTAILRFPGLDGRLTPQLKGEVVQVSADLTQEQATGQTYFAVRLKVEPGELESAGLPALKPGMPAEAFVQTASRTPLSYLLQPLTDQVMRAFRED